MDPSRLTLIAKEAPGSLLRSGTTSGEIILQDSTGAGNLEEGPGTVERVVGHFSVRVP